MERKRYQYNDAKTRIKLEALKSKYIENPYPKQVNGEWLILGKFRKATEVDQYFRELIDEYIKKRGRTYTFRTVCNKVSEDGVLIQKTALRRLFNRVGITFRNESHRRRSNKYTITFPFDVGDFLGYLGKDYKPFMIDILRIVANLPTESMLIMMPGGKRVLLRKNEDENISLLILTDLTPTELSIIQRVSKKGYKYHEIELIKKEFMSYPGWYVLGGTLTPELESVPKETKGEKVEIKIQWPTGNDLLNPDGTIRQ